MAAQSRIARIESSLASVDPTLIPLVRSFCVGYVASVGPDALKILLAIIMGGSRSKGKSSNFVAGIRQLLSTLQSGFSMSGMGFCAAVSVGGAKWGESKVEPFVRYLIGDKPKVSLNDHAKLQEVTEKMKGTNTTIEWEEERLRLTIHRTRIRAISTLIASTISSLLAITLMQSSKTYAQARTSKLVATTSHKFVLQQSPTLDLTLFLLVRALDSLVRGSYETYSATTTATTNLASRIVGVVAKQADSLVFFLSCFRIMWCWYFVPAGLPSGYQRWITSMYDMDQPSLEILRFARAGEYTYGETPSAAVAALCQAMDLKVGRSNMTAFPQHIHSLDCTYMHGSSDTSSCSVNAVVRFSGAFVRAFKMYGPVHLLPQLIFNSRRIMSNPLPAIVKVLAATAQSSAFLATFVAAMPITICVARNFVGPTFLPMVQPQVWDSGLAALLGSAAVGSSILIENPRRRKELALYVLPRALYSLLDGMLPSFLSRGTRGMILSRWIERIAFALSTGVVTTATIYRPDLVSGMIRGVMEISIGNWNGPLASTKSLKA